VFVKEFSIVGVSANAKGNTEKKNKIIPHKIQVLIFHFFIGAYF